MALRRLKLIWRILADAAEVWNKILPNSIELYSEYGRDKKNFGS